MEGSTMIRIYGSQHAQDRLGHLDIEGAIHDALTSAAEIVEARVTEVLSHPPGPDHSVPWLRSGSLRASIAHQTEGTVSVIGSTSDVAVDQELGTRSIPPRPFLAPTAAAASADVAASIAATLAKSLSGR
jgi:hypothetical protein